MLKTSTIYFEFYQSLYTVHQQLFLILQYNFFKIISTSICF